MDSVWTPHVYISNSLDKKNLLADVSTVAISHDGVVATFLERVVETMCNLNLEKYPYDTQNCPLNIYDSHLVPGVELQVGIYFFSQSWSESLSYSCEWYLETQKTEIVSVYGIDVPYVSLKVHRKTTFCAVCLAQPMVLTSFMFPDKRQFFNLLNYFKQGLFPVQSVWNYLSYSFTNI